MSTLLRGSIVAFVIVAAAGRPAGAAVVKIADTAGLPVAGATALCLEPASAEPVAQRDGLAALPASCRRARCDAAGYLASEVAIGDGSASCVLRPGLLLSGEVPVSAMRSGLEARLLRPGVTSPAATVAPAKGGDGRVARFALPAVAPGRYVLELARLGDGWSCRADLGPLGAGRHTVNPEWREPMRVAVRVVDSADKAAAKVPVRALREAPRAEERPGAAKPASGSWSCATAGAPSVATDEKGTATVAAADGEETLIVAGDWKDVRGVAVEAVDRPPSAPLTLRLVRPARLHAKLLDERDRSVACRASLAVRPSAAPRLAGVVPGGGTSGTCAPDGTLEIGPFLPQGGTLEVSPAPGLPLRIAIDPPAPGGTLDLGVVRVRLGESIDVKVRDPDGHPVPKAKVTARGRAGIVLSVEGTTDAAGNVALVGFPRSAAMVIEVEARGYVAAHEDGLAIGDSPFTIVLKPGGVIEGSVRDRDGAAIAGATVAASRASGNATADSDGAFALDALPDGSYAVSARAEGYAPSRGIAVEIRDGKPDRSVDLVLDAATPLRGRIVDAEGSPVGGARVLLIPRWDADDPDRARVATEAASGSDGGFELATEIEPDQWLVALHPGFAPGVERSPANAQKQGDVVVALGNPAGLRVHYAVRDKAPRRIHVVDGSGLGHDALTNGAGETDLADLGAGPAVVSLQGGARREVTLVAGQFAEVTLDEAPWIEGFVTADGAPAPRVYVHAGEESRDRQGGGSGVFTDQRGAYRVEGLGPGPWRVVAVGEDGRADAKVDLPESGPTRLDLELRLARVEVTAVRADRSEPIPNLGVTVMPTGAKCSYMMSTTSWGTPGDLGFDLQVGGDGCLSARTDTAGVARLVLAGPGTYALSIRDDGYEPYDAPLGVGEGTTTRRVVLSPKEKPGKGTVHVRLATDPPGLSGTFTCTQGGNTWASSPVRGEHDCPDLRPGPADVIFHVEGFGAGRAAVEVPDGGEVTADLAVVRGGRLVVPASSKTATAPRVVDGTGFVWSDPAGQGPIHGVGSDLPDVGKAWVFDDLPPGTYTVTVEGGTRSPVPLSSGGTAIAN